MIEWLKESSEGAILNLHIQPKASKTEVAGQYGDALRLRIAAPPVEGAANKALCRYLAESFSIPQNRVEILGGLTGRKKRILLRGVSAKEVQEILQV